MANVLIGLGSNGLLVNELGENCLDVARYLQTKIAFPFYESDEAFKETCGICMK